MRKITVSVPEDVYRAALIQAAAEGKSVNSLVVEFLYALTEREARFMRLRAKQLQVQQKIHQFRARDGLGRDEIHHRVVH